MPTGVYAELRNASNRRFVLVEEQTRAKNRLQKWIAVYFPEYKGTYTHIDAKGGLLVLKQAPTPEEIVRLGVEGIIKIWKDAKLRGNGHKKAMLILNAAMKSIGLKAGLTEARMEIQDLIEDYELQTKRLERVNDLIKELCQQIRYADKLLEIKGIGITTVAGFIAEVGNITRFDSTKELQKLAGLELVADSSGKHNGKTKIKTIAYGGDGMNKSWETDTFHFLKEHHAPYGLMNGYGMTEMAGPVCTSNHKFPVMLPFFCNNIKILDIDTGEELGYDKEGEICVSGPSMMLEYYKNPEATREIIFEENGTRWLRTGDLGHVTKEGYFRLTGRLKRILWSIGADKTPSRVYPMEIENVLSRHSAVDKCAVVGRLNGEKGYLVIAYVTLKSKDIGDNVEKELRQLCRQELKENSWPFEYHFVEKLPTTGAGKIDFRTLEKWAENSDSF